MNFRTPLAAYYVALLFCSVTSLALIAGWVMNVVSLFRMDWNGEVTFSMVARIVGVAVPVIGGVLGWV